MWCIGRITAEHRERMYDLLGLYAKPYDAAQPVICLDEKSKQLFQQTRRPLPAVAGQIAKKIMSISGPGHETCLWLWSPEAVIVKWR